MLKNLLTLSLAAATLASGKERPNILFIFSDDHRHDLIGKVNPLIDTPHLDALADSGVRFNRAYVTTAICSPSRAASLSGRYGSRNGVPTLSDPLTFPLATFAHDLAKAGYRTAHAGKWHLGTTPSAAGFQHYARINSNGSWFNRNIDTNIAGVAGNLSGTFYETFMADVVIDWIDDHTTHHADDPFIMWWCNQVPHVDGALKYPDVKTDPANKIQHTPWGSTGGYHATYNVADMLVPGNWSDPLTTKPSYLATSRFVTKSGTEDYGGPGGYTNPAAGVRNATLGEDNVQNHQLRYNASITALDAEIGRVIARLEDPNGDSNTDDSILDNTWIIFMGDNGWQTGHHKFTSKVLAYEEASRVPLIIKAPGVTARVENQFALNIDLTAMFYNLAGLPAPPHLQGRNLRKLVQDTTTPWRDKFYYEAVTPEASLDAEPHDAIRTDQHKLIRTYASAADAAANTSVVFEELYDLIADPIEMVNLAGDPAHAATKASLITDLETEKAAIATSPDPALPTGANLLDNPSFDTGDKTGWDSSPSTGAGDQSNVVTTPLDRGSHSLQFNSGSASSAVQQLGFGLQDFTADWLFQYDGVISNRVMNIQARSNNSDRLNIRITAGAVQFYDGSTWTTPTGVAGTNAFEVGTVYQFTLTGLDWGDTTSTASDAGTYTLSWVDLEDGSSNGSYASTGQSNNGYRFAMPNTLENGELQGLRFLDDFGNTSDPAWRIDTVSLQNLTPSPATNPNTSFTTWSASHSLVGNTVDSDSDSDGLTDGLEYFFLTNPSQSQPNPFAISRNLSGCLEIRFPLNAVLSGVDWDLIYSKDLTGDWKPISCAITTESSDGSADQLLAVPAPTGDDTGFFRLSACFFGQ
ncbi:sulfatase-like hydrolase/transferase [Haloferula sp.]|uniref:sulfatase-like hydrolase/transferase n=1 Tax=Haloferula sp. TaxID=2497595 RepID=UPI00329CB5D0